MRKKAGNEIEVRSFSSTVEIRAAGDDSTTAPVIYGYAAMYNERSTGLPYFSEIIMPGAFDESDMESCAALFNHDENIILGSIRGQSLKLTVDNKGLAYEITPPDNQYIRDMVIGPMKRGDLSKSSFRFQLDENDLGADEWIWDSVNDIAVRKIHKIARVLDVSPVLFPAYEASDSAVRKAGEVSELKDKADRAETDLNPNVAGIEFLL